jgi:hypothetical protein
VTLWRRREQILYHLNTHDDHLSGDGILRDTRNGDEEEKSSLSWCFVFLLEREEEDLEGTERTSHATKRKTSSRTSVLQRGSVHIIIIIIIDPMRVFVVATRTPTLVSVGARGATGDDGNGRRRGERSRGRCGGEGGRSGEEEVKKGRREQQQREFFFG